MEAIGQLTGGVAHDFNNLLTVIVGGLDMMIRRPENTAPDDAPCHRRHVAAARRGEQLTQQLLAFAAGLLAPPDAGPKPTDVNRLIAGMEELIRRTVGPTIAVEVVGAGGLWPIRGRSRRSWKTRCSICASTRATPCPTAAQLTIETANTGSTSAPRTSATCPPGQYVALCVTDTGTGMAPRGDRPGLRSVLHHQADRRGHRAGPVDDLRLRAPVRRPGAHLFRSRARARRCASICRAISAPRRQPRPRRPPERAAAPSGRDGAGGRRRADRAHADRRGAGGARL